MDLGQIASGLASQPTAWLLTLSLGALAYLYRERNASQAALLESIQKQEAAHRETMGKILPLAEKMLQAVDAIERLSETVAKAK